MADTNSVATPEGGAAVRVPVRLHVFDFALPREVHFDSQLNLSVQALAKNPGTMAVWAITIVLLEEILDFAKIYVG